MSTIYIYIQNGTVDRTGQCQQSGCDVVYGDDGGSDEKDYNGDKDG